MATLEAGGQLGRQENQEDELILKGSNADAALTGAAAAAAAEATLANASLLSC